MLPFGGGGVKRRRPEVEKGHETKADQYDIHTTLPNHLYSCSRCSVILWHRVASLSLKGNKVLVVLGVIMKSLGRSHSLPTSCIVLANFAGCSDTLWRVKVTCDINKFAYLDVPLVFPGVVLWCSSP